MIRNWLRTFARSERGQDVFEYVLIIGILTVAVLLAVTTDVGVNLINAVVNGVCNSIDNIMTSISCTGIGTPT